MRPRSPFQPFGQFLAEQAGTTAVEFVLILIPLIAFTIGTINASIMLYTYTTLHYAAEDTARCMTVQPTVCADAGTVATYAATVYQGPGTATFTPSQTNDSNGNGMCNLVVGTMNYNFTTGITSTTVPLSASACYPLS